MALIKLGAEVCADLEAGLQREWLETDGQGGFAMGTVAGCATRRYHGLLVAATQPPVGRRVLLARLEARVRLNGHEYPLSTNLYPGTVHPEGYRYLEEFRLDPWPVWRFRAGGVELEQAVFMPHGEGCTVVGYTVLAAPRPVWLLLRPLVACRDYHHLARASTHFNTATQTGEYRCSLQPWGEDSRVTLVHPGGEFWPDGLWYYNFLLPREQERGLDAAEDLYSPGEIAFQVPPGGTAYLVAGTAPDLEARPREWEAEERTRREALQVAAPAPDPVTRRLTLAADQFLVRRRVAGEDLSSLMAGYPWFTDWGRDAMIALPGLLLTTERYAEAAQVLRAFACHVQDGLLPNTFSDTGGGAAYNTVDAALWFVHAVRQYARQTEDLETVARYLYAPALQVVAAYRAGTHYDIHMDQDGLISAGSPETQLTWMDAKIGHQVFTPRHGKAVEINALWYNALRSAQDLAERLGEPERAGELKELGELVRESFCPVFWNEEKGWLNDCVRPGEVDASLRPNQVIALSLPYVVVARDRAERLLEAVGRHLLTPYGLRTLAPFEPGYRGRCSGDQWQRDGAYHQGTVWPWLLGPYVSGYLWVHGVSQETRRQARELLAPLVRSLDEAGLGSVSEIYDGDPPHAPRGCPAQAWSVAEVLRCWVAYRLGEV